MNQQYKARPRLSSFNTNKEKAPKKGVKRGNKIITVDKCHIPVRVYF